ncbi:MAG: hypothetical protein AD742_17925 [Methylibium sp. NZG]|nr:MAG: hypothetical protein AD742_17925 [Methylibium sp. NZG]
MEDAAGPEPLPQGTLLRHYRLDSVAHADRFGLVYRATDVHSREELAIKELFPAAHALRTEEQTLVPRDAAGETAHAKALDLARRAFVKQGRWLAELASASTPAVLAEWQERGTAYRAMPWVEGTTLAARFATVNGPADEWLLRSILGPLLDALQALHRRRVQHGRLTPARVLLTKDMRVLLLGLHQVPGLSEKPSADDAYLPLELLRAPGAEPGTEPGATRVGPWSDIYSVGAIVHRAITGMPPALTSLRLVNGESPSLARIAEGDYDDGFLRAIDWALSMQPLKRPRDVEQFRARLGLGRRRVPTVAGVPAAGQARKEAAVHTQDDETPGRADALSSAPSSPPSAHTGSGRPGRDDTSAPGELRFRELPDHVAPSRLTPPTKRPVASATPSRDRFAKTDFAETLPAAFARDENPIDAAPRVRATPDVPPAAAGFADTEILQAPADLSRGAPVAGTAIWLPLPLPPAVALANGAATTPAEAQPLPAAPPLAGKPAVSEPASMSDKPAEPAASGESARLGKSPDKRDPTAPYRVTAEPASDSQAIAAKAPATQGAVAPLDPTAPGDSVISIMSPRPRASRPEPAGSPAWHATVQSTLPMSLNPGGPGQPTAAGRVGRAAWIGLAALTAAAVLGGLWAVQALPPVQSSSSIDDAVRAVPMAAGNRAAAPSAAAATVLVTNPAFGGAPAPADPTSRTESPGDMPPASPPGATPADEGATTSVPRATITGSTAGSAAGPAVAAPPVARAGVALPKATPISTARADGERSAAAPAKTLTDAHCADRLVRLSLGDPGPPATNSKAQGACP